LTRIVCSSWAECFHDRLKIPSYICRETFFYPLGGNLLFDKFHHGVPVNID
jgi:hypothetical protein